MPRTLTNEEKARSVCARTGIAGNRINGLTPAEVDELAAVYEECIAPEQLLKERCDSFWAKREQRLADQKATDNGGAEKKKLTANTTK
jgi:hypothetical protein